MENITALFTVQNAGIPFSEMRTGISPNDVLISYARRTLLTIGNTPKDRTPVILKISALMSS